MVTVILSHQVSNFAEWKAGFDGHEPIRQQAGVKTLGVYNSVDNPNLVSVITEFPSTEAVHGFMANPLLKEDMAKSGVIGMPEVKILNKV